MATFNVSAFENRLAKSAKCKSVLLDEETGYRMRVATFVKTQTADAYLEAVQKTGGVSFSAPPGKVDGKKASRGGAATGKEAVELASIFLNKSEQES